MAGENRDIKESFLALRRRPVGWLLGSSSRNSSGEEGSHRLKHDQLHEQCLQEQY